MLKHMGTIVIAALVVAALLVAIVAFTVPSTEMVLVKTFGDITAAFDGRQDAQAGLKFKIPLVQEAVHYDARTSVFDDAMSQFQTADKKLMLASMYCAWRVGDPRKMDEKGLRTTVLAEQRLREILRDAKEKTLVQYNMSDFVNTVEKDMKLTQIEDRVYQRLSAQADEYGVKIVAVGIKYLGLPESVTKDVIEAMMKERQQEIQTYRASGEATAKAIRERAQSSSKQILAFAEKKATVIRAEGESAAAKYYDQFRQNESLSIFLRQMEALKQILKDKAVLVLDPGVLPSLGWLREGPPADAAGKTASASAQAPATEKK